ncbi:hypothetical protein [Alteripontixanthobacter maritimus]|nr:hypothetical protein [Alteripontixanthobacter maritimus]
MDKKLPPHVRQNLIYVGEELDIDKQLAVGFGGVVSINDEDERSEDAERECERSTEGQRSQRWAGQSEGTRQARSLAEARLRSESLTDHYLSGEREVLDRYDANFTVTNFGLWVVAPSYPLGVDGPQFHLVIFLPQNPSARPASWGWGVRKLGKFPKFVGPRHTNFPYHDICAQGPLGEAWQPQDGVRQLLNLYSSWLFRHCYLEEIGKWPGRQWGATALYRRTEFHADEWCGCGKFARYRDCHMDADLALSQRDAEAEHIANFNTLHFKRNPPKALKSFIRSEWSKVPAHPLI